MPLLHLVAAVGRDDSKWDERDGDDTLKACSEAKRKQCADRHENAGDTAKDWAQNRLQEEEAKKVENKAATREFATPTAPA